MPKRVKMDGVEHVFPDDFTDDDIATALSGMPSPAAPTPAPVTTPPPAEAGGWRQRMFGADGGEDMIKAIPRHVAGAVTGFVDTVKHPIDAITSMAGGGDSTKNPFLLPSNKDAGFKGSWRDAVDSIPVVGPWAKSVEDEANQRGAVPALMGLGTDLVSAEAASKAAGKMGSAARGVGEWAKNKGVDTVNKAIGTLKSDVKRGSNPGRGYLNSNLGTSSSMESIADKAAAAKDATGRGIESSYANSTARIPQQKVFNAVADPAVEAARVVTGEGGAGSDAAKPYLDYLNSFDSAQVGGPKDYTPSDVWRTKRNVAQNTSWSDPTALGMKSVRQQGVGRLSGVLQEAVPESAPLLEQYGDLTKLADRSADRAANPASMSLSKMFRHGTKSAIGAGVGALFGGPAGAAVGSVAPAVMDSIPFQTAKATALWKGGGALTSSAPLLDMFGKPVTKATALIAAKGKKR